MSPRQTQAPRVLTFIKPLRPNFAVRVVLFLMLVVVVEYFDPSWWAQGAIAASMIVGFLIAYRIFLLDLVRYLIEHPGQAAILGLLLGMLYGQVGVSLGVPEIFWSEYAVTRGFSAMAVTLLMAVLGVNAYYFDRGRDRTREKNDQFLDKRFWKKFRRSRRWLRRIPGLRRVEPWVFRDVRGVGSGLQHEIQQFLKVRRLPFLTMVSMPAIFPLLFPYVPRIEPSGTLPGISRSFESWLIGLGSWSSGIIVGILFVRILIRLSTRLDRVQGANKILQPIALILLTLAMVVSITNDFGDDPNGSKGVARVSVEVLKLAGCLIGFGMTLVLLRWISTLEDRSRWVKGLRSATIVSVVLAVMLTSLDASRWFPGLLGSRVWNWVLFSVDLVALLVLLARVFRRTATQHPGLWPRFFSYLFVVYMALAFLLIWDRLSLWLYWIHLDVSAGMAVCILLAIFSLLGAWLHLLGNRSVVKPDGKIDWPPEPIAPGDRIRIVVPTFLGLMAWIGLANNAEYKLRFPGLDYDRPLNLAQKMDEVYGDLSQTRPIKDRPSLEDRPGSLIDRKTSLNAWFQRARQAQGTEHPKLVVVCSSGGASRAAFWTAVVLDRLGGEAGLPGFDQAIRMMTGASGGMVGSSFYVSQLIEKATTGRAHDPDWLDDVDTNPLPRLASHIALEELPLLMLPRTPWVNLDRGIVLESQFVWKSSRKPALDWKIKDLREREKVGELPSLIFSPVIVDDGRRLLISNLDLHYLAINQGDELVGRQANTGSQPHVVSSLAALEFFKFFDIKNGDALSLGTAARMSASFPFVSPAVNLPSEPPLRLVDAGYYDNFGVNLASIWIGENWEDLRDLGVSGIVLVQVRAFLGRAERMAPPRGEEPPLDLARGFELFGSPIQAFNSGRFTGSVFRNDSELAAMIDYVNEKAEKKDFLTTVILENSSMVQAFSEGRKGDWPGMDDRVHPDDPGLNTEVAMTWYVTEAERKAMKLAIPSLEMAQATYLPGNLAFPAPKATRKAHSVRRDDSSSFAARPIFRLRWIQELARRVKLEENDNHRDFLAKELERALNYERIEALKAWWKPKP